MATIADEMKKAAKKLVNNSKNSKKSKKTMTSTEKARHSNSSVKSSAKKSNKTSSKSSKKRSSASSGGTLANKVQTRRSGIELEPFSLSRRGSYSHATDEEKSRRDSRKALDAAKRKQENQNLARSVGHSRGMQVGEPTKALDGLAVGLGGYFADSLGVRNAVRDHELENRSKRKVNTAITKGSTGKYAPSKYDELERWRDEKYQPFADDWHGSKAGQSLPGRALETLGYMAPTVATNLMAGGGLPGALATASTLLPANTGSRYEEALAAGKTSDEAEIAALKYAIPQTVFDTALGANRFWGKVGNATSKGNVLKEMVKGAAEELPQELASLSWENASRKFYGVDVPLVATEKDENGNYYGAVFDLPMMKDTAAVASIIGAVSGGASSAINNVAVANQARNVVSRTLESDGLDPSSAQSLADISLRLGIGVRAADVGDGVNGFYDKKSRMAIVNPQSTRPAEYVLAHEITHSMEGSEEYEILKTGVEAFYGDRLPAVAKNIVDGYAKGGVELTQEGLEHEIVAFFVQDQMFSNTAQVSSVVKRMDNSLWQRIVNAAKNMAVNLRDTAEEQQMNDLVNRWINAGRVADKSPVGEGVQFSYPNEHRTNFLAAMGKANSKEELRNGDIVTYRYGGDTYVMRVTDIESYDAECIEVIHRRRNKKNEFIAEREMIESGTERTNEGNSEGESQDDSFFGRGWRSVYGNPRYRGETDGSSGIYEGEGNDFEYRNDNEAPGDLPEGQNAPGNRSYSLSIDQNPVDVNGTEVRQGTYSMAQKAEDMGQRDIADEIRYSADVEGENLKGVQHNADTLRAARETTNQTASLEEAVEDFKAKSNRVMAIDQGGLARIAAEGMQTFVDVVKAGDEKLYRDMMIANPRLASEIGRGLQIYSQLKDLTPEGRVFHLQQKVNKEAVKATGYDGLDIEERIESGVAADMPEIVEGWANGTAVASSPGPKGRRLKKKVRRVKKWEDEAAAEKRSSEPGEDIDEADIWEDEFDEFDEINPDDGGGTIANDIRNKRKKKQKEKSASYVTPAKQVIAEAIKSKELSIAQMVKDGDDIQTVAYKLTDFAKSRMARELTQEESFDLFGEIHEELQERATKYRDKRLKELWATDATLSIKGRKFVKKLIEWNNIGAFEDPDVGRKCYKYLGEPLFTDADRNAIMDFETLAKELIDDPNTEIVSDYLSDKEIARLNNDKKKFGADYVADVLQQKSNQIASDYVKSTNWDRLRQAQITSMLSNVKTMLRNITPNALLVPFNYAGDVVASGVDKGISHFTGTRTKGVANPKTALKSAGKGVSKAWNDYKLGVDTSSGNIAELSKRNHFSEDPLFDGRLKVFGKEIKPGKGVNKITDLVGLGLQLGDRPFEEAYRATSLEAQMKLNNVDEPTQLMRDFADIEALQRTFKDDNMLTETVGYIFRGINYVSTAGRSTEFGLGTIVQPFLKTPLNVTKMMVEYSPASLIPVAIDIHRYRNSVGEAKIKAQHKLVNDTSKLVSGCMIMGLAMALKAHGKDDEVERIIGSGDGDYAENRYNEQVHGEQANSIRIGDFFFNYVNMQPIGSTFATGVDLYDALFGEGNSDLPSDILAGVMNTFVNSTDLIYEQSFVKGIADLVGGGYDKNNGVISNLLSVVMGLPLQFIPSLVQQLARATDPYKRITKSDNIFIEAVNKLANAIPGVSGLLPEQVDVFGEPVERYDGKDEWGKVGNTAWDYFNAFVNPLTATVKKENPLADELERLEVETGESLVPSGVERRIGDRRLTAREQSELGKLVGQGFSSAVEELIGNEAYQNLSDEEKARTVKNLKETLTKYHQGQYLKTGDKLDGAQKKAVEAQNHGFTVAQYLTINTMLNTIDDLENPDVSKSTLKRQLIMDNESLSDDAKVYAFTSMGLLSDTQQLNMAEAINQFGTSEIDYINLYTSLREIDESDASAVEKELSAMTAIFEASSGTEEAGFLYDRLFDDTIHIPSYEIPDFSGGVEGAFLSMQGSNFEATWNGNGKYGGAAKDLGLSLQEFAVAYKYGSSCKKKDEFAAKINELDVSAEVKKALVSARNWKPDVSFSDGGSVSVESLMTETKLDTSSSAKKNTNTMRTKEELERLKSVNANSGRDFTNSIIFPTDGDYRFSSDFGMRVHPISGKNKPHTGIDISVKGRKDAPAYSIRSGEVVALKSSNAGYGNHVIIKNDDGKFVLYGHLNTYDKNLKVGDKVTAGQQIGIVGTTGNSTGEHLHIEVREGNAYGTAVDPNTVYDFDNDGQLKETGATTGTVGEGTANPSYSGKGASSGSSSGFSGSSGSSGSTSGGTIARSVRRRRRRSGGNSYGYRSYGY